MRSRLTLLLTSLIVTLAGQAQLVVNETMTPAQLLQDVLLGGGVSVSNITYNGVPSPAAAVLGSGSFTQVGNLGLDAGVILSSGYAATAVGPESNFSSDDLGNNGNDADLQAIVGGPITNFSILEFDFIPTGDTLRFRYVFGSEEYPGYVCSFNDAFGFFLCGPGIAGPFTNNAVNIAVLPDLTTPVTISNVNSGQDNNPNDPFCPAVNPQYYVNNTGGTSVCFGGFTTVLTAFSLVECGQTYHIKLAVADAGGAGDSDPAFDSAVFLEAGSFTSTGQVAPQLTNGVGSEGNEMLEGCGPYTIVFTRIGELDEEATVSLAVAGTATAGVDYTPTFPTELYFAPGVDNLTFTIDVPFDADGMETIVMNVEQLIDCANVIVESEFTFIIDSPPPLNIVLNDITSICGQSNVLAPVVTGGLGQYTYLWNTGETTPTITVEPGVTTTYSVTVNDLCGVAELSEDVTITLPIYPPLDIEVSPPTAIDCLQLGAISVTAATGGDDTFTYEWTLGGVVVGTTATVNVPGGPPLYYVVTVTEGCGTSTQDSVLVTAVPLDPIVVTLTPDPTVICRGDTTALEVLDVTGGNGVYSLAWTDEDGNVLSTTADLEVGVPADHTYTVTATDQCANTGMATVTTLIPNYAQFLVSLPPDQLLCAGDSMQLLATVTGGSGYYELLWNGPDSLSDPIQMVIPDTDTEYSVQAIDRCGEVVSDDMEIKVEYVYTSIVVTNLGQDDWYLQSATLPYALTWVWDMGDDEGTRYRGYEVYHSYLDLEDHWVTLSIVTPNGCSGVDSVLLKPPAHIYFPNAFSPDGDGVNDLFGPVGHEITEFEMTIFDRWGQTVYTTTNPATLWDGTINGSDAAMTGVYVYTYRAVGLYFPPQEGIGHVTLLKGSQD